jgi:hypothetical protein
MVRLLIATLAALAWSGVAVAQPSAPAKPLGTWTRTAGGDRLTVTVEPDRLRCTLAFRQGFTLSADADYLVTHDGLLRGVLRVTGTGMGPEEEMRERSFSCRFKVKRDASLVVSDFEAAGELAGLKKLVEGRYATAEHLLHSELVRVPKARGKGKGLLNVYSSDPNRRIQELINTSEDLPQIQREWERIWITDPPSHLTPERVHGGIQ